MLVHSGSWIQSFQTVLQSTPEAGSLFKDFLLVHKFSKQFIIQIHRTLHNSTSGEKLQKDVKLCMLENCGFTVFKEFLLAPESVFPLFYICQNYFFCWQKFNQALFNVDGFVSFLLNPKALCSINHLLCSDLFKYKGFLNVREKKFSSRT